MPGYVLIAGEAQALSIHPGPQSGVYELPDGRRIALSASQLSIGDQTMSVEITHVGNELWVHLDGRTFELTWQPAVDHFAEEGDHAHDGEARAPMPGSVVSVTVTAGDEVAAGDRLLVIESMKLETTIRASCAGIVAALNVEPGQSFERGDLLAVVRAEN